MRRRRQPKKKRGEKRKEGSAYRMGWLLVMFDLPTNTSEERRKAAQFRSDLLDGGFLMVQYSVYIRPAVTLDKKERLLSYLRSIDPQTGDIRCLFITDHQWKNVEVISNIVKPSRRRIDNHPDIDEQLLFWE